MCRFCTLRERGEGGRGGGGVKKGFTEGVRKRAGGRSVIYASNMNGIAAIILQQQTLHASQE